MFNAAFGFIRVGQKLIFDPQGLQEKIEVEKITKRAGLEGWEKSECQKLMPFKKWCEFFSLTTNVERWWITWSSLLSLISLQNFGTSLFFSNDKGTDFSHYLQNLEKHICSRIWNYPKNNALFTVNARKSRYFAANIWRFQRLIKLCYYAFKNLTLFDNFQTQCWRTLANQK